MPGSIDANGVYIYAEDDPISPFSDFMNLGQESVSDAIGDVSAALDARLDALEAGTGVVPVVAVYSAGATWTKPAHLLAIRVRMTGGGGAGGGAAVTAAGQLSGGSGGGAGAYSEAWFAASSLPSTVAVTVGTGGTGVSGAAGNAGGDTSFGAYLTAPGGTGGTHAAASTSTIAVTPGSGGASGSVSGASGGTIRLSGGTGERTFLVPASNFGTTGNGGSNVFASSQGAGNLNGTGGNGGTGGGGGGGTANLASQVSARTGGNGGVGLVVIEQFFKVA
jgi:hypothetical protein